MSNLTDLEICKRIAEIEGIDHHIEMPDTINAYIYSEQLNKEFNPLKDDGLCFRLMVKHCIELSYYEDEGNAMYYAFFESRNGEMKSCGDYKSAHKSICLTVIGMHEGDQHD